MVWGGRWEGASGWGTHVHPWWMHVDGWQNQYKIVELKKKIKKKNYYRIQYPTSVIYLRELKVGFAYQRSCISVHNRQEVGATHMSINDE